MIEIAGTLKSLSPLTIGAPGDMKVDINGRYSARGFPCMPVAQWRLPAIEEMPSVSVPIVKANTLRGLLRRAGAQHIEQALIERNEQIKLVTYNALRTGAPFGHPDKVAPTVTEIQQAADIPPLAVFGGGPRMLRSCLRVDSGLPIHDHLRERGLIADNYPEYAATTGSEDFPTNNLLAILFRKKTDDAGDFTDPSGARHVVDNYNQSIDAWQTLIGASAANADDADAESGAGRFRGLASLTAMQIVPPSVSFTFSATLDSDAPAALGYFLLSLQTFARNQRLGGNGRIGFGRFALHLYLTTADGASVPVFSPDARGYVLNTQATAIATAVDAANAWLATITAGALDTLMAPSSTSRDDVRNKVARDGDESVAAFDRIVG